MRVRLLYFGVLREMFGGREAVLEMAEGAIVADVLNVYRKRSLRLRGIRLLWL